MLWVTVQKCGCVILSILLFSSSISAETIYLKDRSIVKGTIAFIDDNKLTIETDNQWHEVNAKDIRIIKDGAKYFTVEEYVASVMFPEQAENQENNTMPVQKNSGEGNTSIVNNKTWYIVFGLLAAGLGIVSTTKSNELSKDASKKNDSAESYVSSAQLYAATSESYYDLYLIYGYNSYYDNYLYYYNLSNDNSGLANSSSRQASSLSQESGMYNAAGITLISAGIVLFFYGIFSPINTNQNLKVSFDSNSVKMMFSKKI